MPATPTPAVAPANRHARKKGGRAALAAMALASVTVFAVACSSGSNPSSGNSGSNAGSGTGGGGSQTIAGGGFTVAYSSCMRSHGVKNFPDPNSQGQIAMNGNQISPESPTFQNAAKACEKLAPSGLSPGNQAKDAAIALKFARCMRSHGVTNFPDPTSGGSIALGGGSNINPKSPTFQTAQATCTKLTGFGR
jgi:hypothetical protein